MRIQTSSEPIWKSEIVSWLIPTRTRYPVTKNTKPPSFWVLPGKVWWFEWNVFHIVGLGLLLMTLEGRFSRCVLAGGNMSLEMCFESLKTCHHFEFILFYCCLQVEVWALSCSFCHSYLCHASLPGWWWTLTWRSMINPFSKVAFVPGSSLLWQACPSCSVKECGRLWNKCVWTL